MLPNIHQRELAASATEVGRLLDSVAGPDDRVWPVDRWPPMRLDRPLAIGARGGHGPIRYAVESYVPGTLVVFRFDERGGLSQGLDGTHRLQVEPIDESRTILRHVIDARCRGRMHLVWPLVIEPLHDALIEDAFDRAAAGLGNPPRRVPYTAWVRLLRSVARRRHPAGDSSRLSSR